MFGGIIKYIIANVKATVQLLYTFWYLRNENVDIDFLNETGAERSTQYKRLVLTFYRLTTVFYEWGWGPCFHFAVFKPKERFAESICRHELELLRGMKLKPGASVLDVGCGIGGPAINIAQNTKYKITGLNINPYQIERAKNDAKSLGLNDQVQFVVGDFMKMDFPPNHFDGTYAIEATCHAPRKEDVYAEIYRVTKPGCYFAVYEWCLTDKFNPNDSQHQKIKKEVEIGNGLPISVFPEQCMQTLRKVGFEIMEHRDAFAGDKTWWKFLEPNPILPSTYQFTAIGRFFIRNILRFLEMVHLAPKGVVKMFDVLITAAHGLCGAGREQIYTVGYYILAYKPLK